ncbi:MAG: hypothetical protein WC504_01005 [Methylobacter sp.]
MNIISKNWVELRELPDSENAEISYIRLQDIERVFFIEDSPYQITIFVSALGEKFLYNRVETMQEAVLASKALIQDIENSK